jgi:hypothetical protein
VAHECPECWHNCHCGCDIDDCLLNLEEDVRRCTHHQRPGCSAYEPEDDDRGDAEDDE